MCCGYTLATDVNVAVLMQGAQTRVSRVKVAKMIVGMGGEIDLEQVVQPPQPPPEAQPPLPDPEQPPLPPGLPDDIEGAPPLPDEDSEEDRAVNGGRSAADVRMAYTPLPSDRSVDPAMRGQTRPVARDEAPARAQGQESQRRIDRSPETRGGHKHIDWELRRSEDRDRGHEHSVDRGPDAGTRDSNREGARDRDRNRSFQDRDIDRRERDCNRDRVRGRDKDRGRDRDRGHAMDYSRRRDRDRDTQGRVRDDRDYRRDRDDGRRNRR